MPAFRGYNAEVMGLINWWRRGHFTLQTVLPYHITAVQPLFGEPLFRYLTKDQSLAEVIAYEGNRLGAKVHVRLHMGLLTQDWISKIVRVEQTPDRYEFYDMGAVLPVFLTGWKHRHCLEAQPDGTTLVTDEIWFASRKFFPRIVVEWALRRQIEERQRGYQEFYKQELGSVKA